MAIEEKALNISKWMANLNSEADAYENEIKRLTDHKRAVDNKVKWLKQYLQTYVRRYLYTIAFEIAESDICDQQPPQENKPTRQKQQKEPMATEKQLADMVKLAKEKNLVAKMPDLLKQIAGVSSSKELTLDMADKVICTLAEMNAAWP